MTTLKQEIRLWFEFYKLALNHQQIVPSAGAKRRDKQYAHFGRDLARTVEKTKPQYQQWGDIRNVKFDSWWTTRTDLFGETRVQQVERVSNRPDTLYVSVPLAQPITRSIAQLRSIITKAQARSAEQTGIARTKSKRTLQGAFHMTPGAEIRTYTLQQILILYRDIYLPMNRPKINSTFLAAVQAHFKKRQNNKRIPGTLSASVGEQYEENALRALRRYIRQAERLMIAAATGDFPGRKLI